MSKPKGIGKFCRTERGFERRDFKDCYGAESSVQESSSVDKRLWLGRDEPTYHHTLKEANGSPQFCGCRMHLTPEQVKRLIVTLQRWLDTDSLK